jgi:DNA-binding NtrC family response regulator
VAAEAPAGSNNASLKDAEAGVIRSLLAEHGGSRVKTARALGINPSTLWRKMKRLGIA